MRWPSRSTNWATPRALSAPASGTAVRLACPISVAGGLLLCCGEVVGLRRVVLRRAAHEEADRERREDAEDPEEDRAAAAGGPSRCALAPLCAGARPAVRALVVEQRADGGVGGGVRDLRQVARPGHAPRARRRRRARARDSRRLRHPVTGPGGGVLVLLAGDSEWGCASRGGVSARVPPEGPSVRDRLVGAIAGAAAGAMRSVRAGCVVRAVLGEQSRTACWSAGRSSICAMSGGKRSEGRRYRAAAMTDAPLRPSRSTGPSMRCTASRSSR